MNPPIDLDDPQWSQLRHCYGPATDTPKLLRQLEVFPESKGNREPWFTLWSSLCHQGDVYPASFAAVPHVVRVLASAPARATFDFFLFPAYVEICRANHEMTVQDDLKGPYVAAIKRLPSLAGLSAAAEWSDEFLPCVLGAIAVGKGYPRVGEAVLELNGAVAGEFLEWFRNR